MKAELVWMRVFDRPTSQADSHEHYKMGLISPHDSAGCMCIMWVNLIQIFPSSDRLLTQQ